MAHSAREDNRNVMQYLKIDVFESSVDAVGELGDRSGVTGHSVDSHDLETPRLDDARAHLDDQRHVFGERGRRAELERHLEGGSFGRQLRRGRGRRAASLTVHSSELLRHSSLPGFRFGRR